MKKVTCYLTLVLFIGCKIITAQHFQVKSVSYSLPLGFSEIIELPDGDFMFSALASPSAFDSSVALVIRVDTNLNVKWARRYKTLHKDDFSTLVQLSDGNVLVGGATRQQFSVNEGASLYKIDTAGNVLWQKLYKGSGDDRLLEIFELADQSIMIFIRRGATNQPTKIVHLSSTGTILSQKTFYHGTNFGLLANAVTRDSSGTFYLTGQFYNGPLARSEVFIAAYDGTSVQWLKFYDLKRSATNYIVQYTPDGHLLLGGTILDSVAQSRTNMWMMKTDLQGNVMWLKEYEQSQTWSEALVDLIPIGTSGHIAYGRADDDNGSDGLFFKIDNNGDLLWTRGFDQYAVEAASLGKLIKDGRIFMVARGYSDPNLLMLMDTMGQVACNSSNLSLTDFDTPYSVSTKSTTSQNPGLTEVILSDTNYAVGISSTLVCSGGVGIDSQLYKASVVLFPNPASQWLKVSIPTSHNPTAIVIYDVLGHSYKLQHRNEDDGLKVDVSSLTNGMYFLKVSGDEEIYSARFIKGD